MYSLYMKMKKKTSEATGVRSFFSFSFFPKSQLLFPVCLLQWCVQGRQMEKLQWWSSEFTIANWIKQRCWKFQVIKHSSSTFQAVCVCSCAWAWASETGAHIGLLYQPGRTRKRKSAQRCNKCTLLIPKAFSAWLIFYMGPLHVAPGSCSAQPYTGPDHLFDLCVTEAVRDDGTS